MKYSNMNIKYSLLIIILILLSYYLLTKKEDFLSPAIVEIQYDENQERYKKFQEMQEKILSETDFQIGYKTTENTDKKTIGLCPLGKYYKGEIPEEIKPKDMSKCVPCTKCFPGHYLKEGCSGNSDSVCEAEKVPHNIFIRSHGESKQLHNLVNPHQHPYGFYQEPNVGQKFKLSSFDHYHI